jgi:hypothetical protein
VGNLVSGQDPRGMDEIYNLPKLNRKNPKSGGKAAMKANALRNFYPTPKFINVRLTS